MKKLRKALCLVIASCMALSLAACNSNGNTDSSSQGNESAGSQTESTANGEGEPAELVFWDMPWGSSEYQNVAQGLIDDFMEEYPNIKVTYQSIPWDSSSVTFQTAVTSGTTLDVSTGPGLQSLQFHAMGKMIDVSDVMAELEEEGTEWSAGTAEQFNVDGFQTALPFNVDPRGIFYRADWLEEAGLDVPTTWDELFEVMEAMTHDDVYGMALAGDNHWAFYQFMFGNGGAYVTEDQQANINTPEVKGALEFYAKMRDSGVIPPGAAGSKEDDAKKMYMQGKAWCIPCGPDFGPVIEETSQEVYDNTEVLPVLESPNGTVRSPMGMNGLMGYSDSKYPEAVKTFMKWWTLNNGALWEDGGMGAFPADTTKNELPAIKDNKIKNFFAEEVMPHGCSLNYPSLSAFPAMSSLEGEDLARELSTEVLGGNNDFDTILSDMNDRIQQIIDSNN